MGFETVKDLWSWVSCVDLMHKVTDFPLLLVNADDDPVVPKEMHSIPMQYTGNAAVELSCAKAGKTG